jgi:hypothetical protein
MMEAVRTSETSVDNHFTRQYNPEDSSEHENMNIIIKLSSPASFRQATYSCCVEFHETVCGKAQANLHFYDDGYEASSPA